MRVLITGGSGFVASHLANFLLEKKCEVYVLVRQRADDNQLDRLDNLDKITVVKGDLLSYISASEVLNKIRPDKIFHLASQSFVKASFEDPVGTLYNNIFLNVNLLEAIRSLDYKPIVHLAGSSEEYGKVLEEELPIKETNPLRPLSPYGVSKVTQTMLGYQYHKSYGLPIILTRAFNHDGPKRGRQFFLSNMCYQVARAERGWGPPTIEVGDLSSSRDTTHVKDMVRAYWLAAEKCNPGEIYNIGSGVAYTMREILNKIISESTKTFKIKVDPNRIRPSDVTKLICDATKFREKTNWKPELGIDDIIKDTLNYWRVKFREA